VFSQAQITGPHSVPSWLAEDQPARPFLAATQLPWEDFPPPRNGMRLSIQLVVLQSI